MNIVITTQYMENYSDDMNAPYWKYKGGRDYILRGRDIARSESYAELVRRIREVIEYSHEFAEEFIASIELVTDLSLDEGISTLYEITDCGPEKGFECAKHHYENAWNDQGEVVRGDLIKVEFWTMLPRGERKDYDVDYYGNSAA